MKFIFYCIPVLLLVTSGFSPTEQQQNDHLLFDAINELGEASYYTVPIENCSNSNQNSLACYSDPETYWLTYQTRHCSEITRESPNLDKLQFPEIESITSFIIQSDQKENGENPAFQITQWKFCEAEEAENVQNALESLTYDERKCIHNGPWRWWQMDKMVFVIFSPNTTFPSEFQVVSALLEESMK